MWYSATLLNKRSKGAVISAHSASLAQKIKNKDSKHTNKRVKNQLTPPAGFIEFHHSKFGGFTIEMQLQ